MTEDRSCGTCARYQNGVACKFGEPIKDPKGGVFGCKNWTDKPEDIESNPVARGPIITDCLPGSPSVCINCAQYNPTDGYCRLRSVRVYPAESTTCMNWLHKQYRPKQQENQPVFGGTSLKELGEKQKVDDLEYAKRRKALDYGAKQGITMEALDTVFAIACQQVPSMEKRWMELRAEINIMFAQKWAGEEMSE